MSAVALLTAVEFASSVPAGDAERLSGLGFVVRAAGGGPGVELRTCADPYGCRVVVRAGPRAALRQLTWRLPDADRLDAAVRAVRAGRTVAGLVSDAGWVGDGFRIEHPDGSSSVLHWQQDREWVAGPALSCPLHPDGSTRLCDVAPPLVQAVAVPAAVGDLVRWAEAVLGRTTTVALVPADGPGLLLRSGLVRSAEVSTSPGGLTLRLTPDEVFRALESEHVF